MTNPLPKTITGPLHTDNKQASDWGYQGFIGYGCHRYVVVVDPNTLQVIQTLGPHNSTVTHLKWSREKYHHAFATGRTYSLMLAAADSGGSILIWDVVNGTVRTDFQRPSVHIRFLDLEWLPGHDESHDLLLVLRYPGQLELWDAYAGAPLWKKEFGENLLSFALDPFNMNRVVCLSEVTHLVLASDVNTTKEPQTEKFKYLWYSDPNPVVNNSSMRHQNSGERSPRRTSSSSWTKMANLATNILPGASDSLSKRWSISEDQDTLSSCLQTVFSPIHNHLVLLVFSTEIQFMDVDIELVLSSIRLDRSSPYIMKVIPCCTSDMLFCLHDNGSTSVRVRKQKPAEKNTAHEALDLTYAQCCLSDPIRLLRQVKIVGFLHHPGMEKQVSVLLSDSRLILLDVMAFSFHKDDPLVGCNNITLGETVNGLTVVPLSGNDLTNQEEVTLRLVVSGLVSGVNYPIMCISMRPSMATVHEAGQHLAVGSGCGTVQLVNVYSGQVEHEYKLFSNPVRGMTWMWASRIITYSYSEPSSYGNRGVRNEIIVLNTKTGEVTEIRGNIKNEGPIQFLHPSPSGKYMVLAVKDKPIEMWNIPAKQLLKELTDLQHRPTFISWHPSLVLKVSGKNEERRTRSVEQCFIAINYEGGCVARVPVSDGFVKDMTVFPNDKLFAQSSGKLDLVTIVWKDMFLIVADRGGQLFLKHGGKEFAKKISEKPGTCCKCVRFAPGKKNYKFLVLYEQAVDIWEIVDDKAEFVTCSPTLYPTSIDAAWTGPESVAIVTEDCCVHILKIATRSPSSPTTDDFVHIHERNMKITNFPMKNWKVSDVFSPAILDRKTAFLLKYSLQCNIEPFNADIQSLLQLISSEMRTAVQNAQSTCDRCLLISRLFGDEFDQEFWETFKYVSKFGRTDKTELGDLRKPFDLSGWMTKLASPSTGVTDLLDLSTSDLETKLTSNDLTQSDLDSSWVNGLVKEREPYVVASMGLSMDHTDYKNYEASRLLLHNKRADSYRAKKVCTSRFIMIGKVTMATQVLMETDTDNIEFRHDYLKACLTSCVQPSSESVGTLKLAATHLIAAGHIQEGVDLLCLMKKQADACKYLITYGNWLEAIWLAKISLSDTEVLGVICKFTEYLWQSSQKMKAILLMLSAGQYSTVLQMLFSLGQYDTAALFLQACLEQGLLSNTANKSEVYLEFAKFLTVTQYHSALEYYCTQAGGKGLQLLQEIQSLNKTLNLS